MRTLFLFFLFATSVASAQITDSFSDGDFTNNPTWSGDDSVYTIVTNKLRSNKTIASSKFYLSTPSTLANNCQWEFWVNLQFNTSSANYVDVYLTSDQANLKAATINGYFVRLGNTNDNICLYKKVAGTETPIINGVVGILNTSNNTLKVKVVRDASNNFTLSRDIGATGTYTVEGAIIDASSTSSSFFGVNITQSTASFFQKHFFDDFYVGPIILDVTAPTIVSSTVISNTQLDVLFDESVDLATSQTLINYSANNGLGSPSTATRDVSNFSLVHLTFATAFTSGLANTLTIINVQDFSSNAITTATTNFTYIAPVTASFKDIIFNELYIDFNPLVGLPGAQFIELYNRSANAYNLNGWQISDLSGSSTAILGNYTLLPNQYIIVCKASDTALYASYGNHTGTPSFPLLNQAGDNLKLKDNTLVTIDSVSYSDTWYQDATKKSGGWSLELINPNSSINCAQSSNWIASNNTAGGTPGTQNSVYSTAPDVTAPTISSITATDATHISVCFSEGINASQIAALGNYSINNGIGVPIAAVSNSSLTCVDLTLGTALISTNYILTLTNLGDCSGNTVSPSTGNFTYVIPVAPTFKDVIINEIYADFNPLVGLPAAQFIELYNRSTHTFNLNGWKFSDATGSSTSTFGNYYLAPNQYLIVCKATDTALFASYGNHIGTSSFPSLNLSGDNLKLKDNALVDIDSVNYSDTWYRDATKKAGGWSLELINPNAPLGCPASTNWIASNNVNGGTPGIQNSVYSTALDITSPSIAGVTVIDSTHITVCFSEALDASQINILSNFNVSNGIGNPLTDTANASLTCVNLSLATALTSTTTYTLTLTNLSDCSGNALSPASATFTYYKVKPFDVVINEIMADPDPAVSLPNYEYVELFNRTQFPINLNNWTFTTGTTSKILPNVFIQPDSFVVIISTIGATNYPAGTIAFATLSTSLALTNTGQTLILNTPEGKTISTVSYTDNWYQDANKKNGGYSLEQIDPNNPCAGMSNWHVTANPFGGTPGRKNSIYAVNADNTPPQVTRVSVIATDTIQLFFNEPLDNSTMLNTSIYSIDNGIGMPTQILTIAPDFKSVRLTLPSALQVGIIYTITVNNSITDCVGNPLGTDNSARFAIPEPALPNDIVINEILFDPNAGGVDFVEIYNRSNKVIDLKTMNISQYDTINNIQTSIKAITSDGYLIFPKDYLVLSTDGAAIKTQYNTSNPEGFLDLPSMPSMNITGGTVCLGTSTNIIDNFKYYADMHFGLLNITKGISLERIDFNRPTQDRTNWHSAAETVGFATPAYKNSQYNDAGITDNAIEITPELFSPDEDGYNDIVNINYHFDTPGFTANVTVYDSKGRVVKQLIRNELLGLKGTFSWDGINEEREKARIGIYIVFFEVFDLSGNVKHYKKTCVLAGKL